MQVLFVAINRYIILTFQFELQYAVRYKKVFFLTKLSFCNPIRSLGISKLAIGKMYRTTLLSICIIISTLKNCSFRNMRKSAETDSEIENSLGNRSFSFTKNIINQKLSSKLNWTIKRLK